MKNQVTVCTSKTKNKLVKISGGILAVLVAAVTTYAFSSPTTGPGESNSSAGSLISRMAGDNFEKGEHSLVKIAEKLTVLENKVDELVDGSNGGGSVSQKGECGEDHGKYLNRRPSAICAKGKSTIPQADHVKNTWNWTCEGINGGDNTDCQAYNFYSPEITEGTYRDTRDQAIYQWRRMRDGKVWMAENIECDLLEGRHTTGRYFKPSAFAEVCPEYWRLPTMSEWETLKFHMSQGNHSYSSPFGFNSLLSGYAERNSNYASAYEDKGSKAYYPASEGGGVIINKENVLTTHSSSLFNENYYYTVRCIFEGE